eukprot:TRINITY_DN3043_c0_g7_i1.p1 TRINITY_DN3043_c0_g7~~TRINITY_DN3043_c0_g7_i1.p1  ORF type:complete len:150 (-),score=13.60 TRINITY_DN3043_c0_g7_i1:40-489(-)
MVETCLNGSPAPMNLKTLPREFSLPLQSSLFTIYFVTGALSLLIMLGLRIYANSSVNISQYSNESLQIWLLAACLVLTLLNLFLFGPLTTRVLNERMKLEKDGSADEAILSGLKKKFGMYHGFSQLTNLIVILAACVHLFFLGQKIKLD